MTQGAAEERAYPGGLVMDRTTAVRIGATVRWRSGLLIVATFLKRRAQWFRAPVSSVIRGALNRPPTARRRPSVPGWPPIAKSEFRRFLQSLV
jgi:hypothetical protein